MIGACKMTITVEIKNNYGYEKIYPACPISRKFAAIAGTKTLTERVIELIKGLGYTVQVEQTVREL